MKLKESVKNGKQEPRDHHQTSDIDLQTGYLFRPVCEKGFVKKGETSHSIRAGCALSLALSDEVDTKAVMNHVGWRSTRSAQYYCRSHLLRNASTTAIILADSTVGLDNEIETFFNKHADF